MDIEIISKEAVANHKESVDFLFSHAFEPPALLEITTEFCCGVLYKIDGDVIACGFAYTREMQQNETRFKAGIVGGIAVSSVHQGKGLCTKIIECLDAELLSNGVEHSFLFAYEPKIYHSSGYIELAAPIHYYDKDQGQWNSFVYRGGMFKSFGRSKLAMNQVIEFNGSVY